MSQQTSLYESVHRYLDRGSCFVDRRHLQVLSWASSNLKCNTSKQGQGNGLRMLQIVAAIEFPQNPCLLGLVFT